MTFKKMLVQQQTYLAPAVFNPLGSKIARAAGFCAIEKATVEK
jgi:2-methylisocitrate lyase-like PEP mutase family enzyme